MLYDGASKTVVGCNSDLKHPEFIGLILGPALSCSAMVRSTSQAARFGARGRDTAQHDCDLWWNWHGQGCASSGFPCWNRGCERSDAILGARGAHVGSWKTKVRSTADTNHDYAPAGSKHPHDKTAVMCWNLRMTRERPPQKNWPENDLDTCTISWTSFREKVGNCQTACALSLRLIRSWLAIVMRNVRMGSTNSRTRNKRSLCRRLSVTVWMLWKTVKTSTVETSRNDELPEDLWPNLSAMVMRLQQLYIGSHEEKLSASEHGFDRDFWAGSPSDRKSECIEST